MGVPKPTEMTIRDLLQEELRKRGVTVVPEFYAFLHSTLDLKRKSTNTVFGVLSIWGEV
jgi:hypothetical protein